MESKLLIYICCFVIILVCLCSLLCVSVFHVWFLSLDSYDFRYNRGSLDYSLFNKTAVTTIVKMIKLPIKEKYENIENLPYHDLFFIFYVLNYIKCVFIS